MHRCQPLRFRQKSMNHHHGFRKIEGRVDERTERDAHKLIHLRDLLIHCHLHRAHLPQTLIDQRLPLYWREMAGGHLQMSGNTLRPQVNVCTRMMPPGI